MIASLEVKTLVLQVMSYICGCLDIILPCDSCTYFSCDTDIDPSALLRWSEKTFVFFWDADSQSVTCCDKFALSGLEFSLTFLSLDWGVLTGSDVVFVGDLESLMYSLKLLLRI